jgi:hypothetical protein
MSSRHKLLLGLILAVAALAPTPAGAREKTDLVYLKNGDRLTGEIKELDRGILQLSTSSLSTVGIEWLDVDSLNSVYQFRVEDRSGHKEFGAIFMRKDGYLEVVKEGVTARIHADSVVVITPIEATFWHQLNGSISIGYSYTQSDEISQLNVNGWIMRRTSRKQTRLSVNSLVKSTSQSAQTVRYDATLDYRKLLRGALFVQASGSVDRNDDQGVKLRTALAVAPGANLIKSNHTQLVVSGGLSVNREWASNDSTSNNLEAVATLEHDIFAYNFPRIDYTATLSVYPSLSDWGRFRSILNFYVRREIVSDFFVELNYYSSRDNRPPAGGAELDYGLTFGIGYSF